MDRLELTPVDIRHKEFKSTMLGYNKDEVREFLDLISSQIEDLQTPTITKQEEITPVIPAIPQPPVEPIEDISETLSQKRELINQTLLFAQQQKAEIIANAKLEADTILKKAELQGKKTIEEARHYLNVLEHQYINIKEQKKHFLLHFRSELGTLLERINQDSILKKENEMAMDQKFYNLKNTASKPIIDEKPKISSEKVPEVNSSVPTSNKTEEKNINFES